MTALASPAERVSGTSALLHGAVSDLARIWSVLLHDAAFTDALAHVAACTERCLRAGNTVFFAGNGGSAAAASHFAAELVGRFRHDRAGFRSVSLSADAALLTALANDLGADQLFSRPLSALGRRGDVLICLTTSGRSPNIIAALRTAKALGITPVTFCGSHTAEVAAFGTVISVPSSDTPRIQEAHDVLLHVVTEQVEFALVRGD